MKYSITIIILFILSSFNQLNAQEVTMRPSFWKVKYYQEDTRISKRQVESLMSNNQEANQLWQKSKRHVAFSYVALGTEFGFLALQLNRASDGKSQTGPLIGVLTTAAIAIGFTKSAFKLKQRAILKYNNNSSTGNINIGPTNNGIGLVWSF